MKAATFRRCTSTPTEAMPSSLWRMARRRMPKRRAHDAVLQAERYQKEGEHHEVVMLRLQQQRADLRLGDRGDAEVAAGHRHPFLQDLPDHPAERDRHHREIGAAYAQRREGERRTEQRRHHGADDHAEPDVQARGGEHRQRRQRLAQQRRGIGARGHQGGVTEREQTGIAGQDVETDGDDAVDQDDDAEELVVGALDQEGECGEQGGRKPRCALPEEAHQARSSWCLPNKPSGFR